MTRHTTPPLLLFLAALLISCGPQAPIPEVRLQRLEPPAALLVCAEAPPPPARAGLTQGRVAEYLVSYAAAHRDCEARLAGVRAWVGRASQ